jgi:hypothetical protein
LAILKWIIDFSVEAKNIKAISNILMGHPGPINQLA